MKVILGILGLVGKIPFLGFALKWANPVWGFVLTVLELALTLIKNMVKGTVSFLKDPLETVAVIGWIVVGVFVGIYIGIQWNKHVATHYKGQLTKIQNAEVKHDTKDARKAIAAEAARLKAEAAKRAELDAAEAAARRRPEPLSLLKQPEPVAVDAALPVAQPKRVRNHKRVRPIQSEPSLQWQDIQESFNQLVGK